MSGIKGGLGAKLGDRYEFRWMTGQLLRLLAEQITSVIIEKIQIEEEGVDLVVVYPCGKREAL